MMMDDLLVHSMKSVYMERLTNLFKAVIKHSLKISPKKCQLFKTNLVYMGKVFHIKDRKILLDLLKLEQKQFKFIPTKEY